MGFFSNLDQEKYDRQYSDRELIKGMASYFKPYALRLILIAVLLTVIASSSAAFLILIGRGVDLLKEDASATTITLLTLTVLVDDINDNRPLFQPYTYDVTMAEHSASGTSVAVVFATDKDLVRGPAPFL